MQITLPFIAFASLNSMPYVHHPEQNHKTVLPVQLTFNDELNYLIPNVLPSIAETEAPETITDTDK